MYDLAQTHRACSPAMLIESASSIALIRTRSLSPLVTTQASGQAGLAESRSNYVCETYIGKPFGTRHYVCITFYVPVLNEAVNSDN
jgi:hypothetical protein